MTFPVSGFPAQPRQNLMSRLIGELRGQADIARRANNIPVARAMFEALDQEAQGLSLDRWEPGLVVECLVGYLSCLRASRQKGEVSPEEVALYRRLAQLKPSLAVEMGT